MVCLLVIIRKEVIRVKAIRIFGRSIRDAFKSITRNFSLSMASILCDMITLIIVSIAIIIAVNVNKERLKLVIISKPFTLSCFKIIEITPTSVVNIYANKKVAYV